MDFVDAFVSYTYSCIYFLLYRRLCMPTLKRFSIVLVCFVYIFSYVIHNFIIAGVRAESTTQHTNIVAIFVDKDIYNTLSSDIQRYASNYIQ